MKKATQTTLTLYAYDPTTGEPAAGLTAASVTTCISKDGATPTQTTNSVAEVSSSILPGWYRLTLTASETDCDTALVTATHATAKFATCELEFQPNDYATATNLTTLQTHGDSEWATADVSGVPAAVWNVTTRTLSELTLSSSEKEAIAQAILTFNVSTLDASTVKYCLNSLIRAGILWERSGLTLKTLKSDGTTTQQSYAMTEDNLSNVIKVC